MNDIVLDGCTPTPLANYLKALGVLRLLSAKYPDTRGFWRGDKFVLRTLLDRAGIEQFFLNGYEPTPIMAPWNGGSGFYYQERKSNEKDPATGKKKKLGIYDQETSATKVVDAVLSSTSKRLDAYRKALVHAKHAVQNAGFITSPQSGKEKDDFILSLRGTLPEECIQAMDSGLAIAGGTTSYPPMLGSGWNDGNLDFTSNFMQRLLDVLGTTNDTVPTWSENWLQASLWGTNAPNLVKNNIGQFSPGQAGGPNASTGFEADAAINPWDFVLMIEGALSFASAAVRRNSDDPFGVMSYPFTVRAVGAGWGSLGEGDVVDSEGKQKARGELWMPLWEQAATYAEVRTLMAEGRVALGKKPARDALDFLRAVHHLGGYRGVQSFQRFGLLMRSGRAYLATPLSRVEIASEPQSRWLDDLDKHQWLDRFRRFAGEKNTANRFHVLRKQLEDRLFTLSGREPGNAETQALLILLGEIQSALAVKAMAPTKKEEKICPPIPRLSSRWVLAADDDTPSFRIAKALTGLRGVGDEPLPLRTQLFPMHRKFDQWMTPEAGEKARIYIGRKGRLTDTLRALLERRLWLAEKLEMKDKPLAGPAGATLDDVTAFLRDDSMDTRIAELLPGLCLCEIPEDTDKSAGDGMLPAAVGLLKLALTPDRTLRSLDWLGEKEHLPVPVGMLAQLAAGNHNNRAVKMAWRRLRSSGMAPVFSVSALPDLTGIDAHRAAAALLIPLRYGATSVLARSVLKTTEPETQTA
jgi:CRISPR-associated protein Csx17